MADVFSTLILLIKFFARYKGLITRQERLVMMNSKIWILAGVLCAAGCGDDDDGEGTPDSGAGVVDADTPSVDADLTPDAGDTTDATPFSPPTPMAVPLSATGPDQLQSAVAGPGGTFYAVGFAATGVAGARTVVVVKLTAAGALDTTFGGGDGVVTTPLEFKGGTDELDIVVQSTGKLVISATVANAINAADTDIALTRLNADGSLDTGFGDQGVRVLVLNDAIDVMGTLTGGDRSRSLGLDATDRIYIHGVQRGEGLIAGNPRTDTDFVVIRLDANGTIDSAFGTDGKYLLDIRAGGVNMTPSSATAHGISVLADGSVIANGYATTEGIGAGAQPVLFKLDVNGDLVPAFNGSGVFHEAVLATQTEIYNVALHGTHLVTAGYGRESGDQNDWVSMRFDVTTGVRDLTWGDAPNGTVLIDPSGTMVGDNCRNAIALPDGKTVLIGSTGPSNMPAQDAVFAVLDATGHLDPAYGDGVHIYAYGGGAGGNDQLWGGVVSGDNVLLVGFKGGGPAAMQTEAMNDDSYAIVLPLQ
jgi:uncharacterized delta-60 repeat protein